MKRNRADSNRHAAKARKGRPALTSLGLFSAGLVAGAAASFAYGGVGADETYALISNRVSLSSAVSERIDSATIGAPATPVPETSSDADEGILARWLDMAEAERLKSLADKVTGAGLDLIAEGVIARLEEDSLKSLIASTTDFSAQELAEIDDVPAFAMNLARIAMEGTVREASAPEADILPIDFSSEITWDHRASLAQSQFSSNEDRIYAVFESGDLALGQTLAKWTRVEDGEIMLFKRHPIRESADSSFVYLNAPPGGFPPGEYRVDFYSADRALRWLASGTHRVSG